MNAISTVRALGALAHEARLAVFRLLVQAGPQGLAAGVVAEQLALAPSALTFHFKELIAAGLLSSRQEGRNVFYSVNANAMKELLAYLTENCCGGVPCGLESASVQCN